MVEPIGDVLDRAAKLSASGRRRKAVALLRSTANSHPDSAEVWCWLAGALLDRGDATAALAAARRALALPGGKASAHRLASKALSRLSRHEEAVAAARQAVRAAPSDWRCRIALAEAFGAAGSWPDAVDAAAQAVRYQPDHVRPYLVLGDAARRTGDIATAERAYRIVMCRKPGNPRVRAELARLRQPPPRERSAGIENLAAIPYTDRPSVFDALPDDGRAPRTSSANRSTSPGWSLSSDQSSPPARSTSPDRRPADWSARGRSTVGRFDPSQFVADGFRTGRPASDQSAAARYPSTDHPAGDDGLSGRKSAFRRNRAFRRTSGGGRPSAVGRPADAGRAAGRDRSPMVEKLTWRAIRQLSMTLVIAGMFLMVAGLPKPTPVLAWLGYAIPGVVVVLALVELIRVPSGSRLLVLAMPVRRPVIGLSCVLLGLSNALVLLWAMLDQANAGTMEPLIFALVCAVCAGAV